MLTSTEHLTKIVTTNCWIHNGGRILLGLKKRSFAEGRWNGFGGKVQPGESLEDAARRELHEECGIAPVEWELAGTIDFEYRGENKAMEVNIFRITSFIGEPRESEEMRPQWFFVDEIPYEQMWPDDRYWLPLFLTGKRFKGNFIFEGYDKILSYHLETI